MELFNDKIRRIFQPFAGITGGRNGIYDTLKDMFKDVLQEMSEAEMDVALGYGKNEARAKTPLTSGTDIPQNLKTKFGNIEMDIPRDRNSEFEPMIVPKYQRNISGIEAVYPKALYSKAYNTSV